MAIGFCWLHRYVFVIILGCLVGGCVGSSGGVEENNEQTDRAGNGNSNFDYAAMFMNLADNVIIPNYSGFKSALQGQASVSGQISQYCAAIGTDDEAERLAAARATWRELMDLWQRAELHNLGPSADQANLLRNQIYSYDSFPLDTCRTDRAVVLAETDPSIVASRLFSSRGLDAMEYLLFEESLLETCGDDNVQTVGWDARPVNDRKLARCHYADLLVSDLLDAATQIENQWLTGDNNYRAAFIDDTDSSTELVLGALSDALFYIEKDTKDEKLGLPLALKSGECSAAACPAEVESPFSRQSLQNIKVNLQSFIALYTGGNGSSFDDIIAGTDTSINTAFSQDVAAAIALVDDLQSDGISLSSEAQRILDEGLSSACLNSNANPTTIQTVRACALHGYLKRISDRMRTDFVTIIGVDLPDRVQGDAD